MSKTTLICLGIFAAIGLILGILRRRRRSGAKFIITLVSAVLAFAAAIIIKLTPELVGKILKAVKATGTVTVLVPQLEENLPENAGLILTLVSVAAAPLVFLGVFIALKIVLDLFELIIALIGRAIRKERRRGWFLGGLIGAVAGVVFALCLLMPVTNVFTIFRDTVGTEQTEAILSDARLPKPIVSVCMKTEPIGRRFFNAMCDKKHGETKISFEKDVPPVYGAAACAAGCTDIDFSDMKESDRDSVLETLDAAEKSWILRKVLAEASNTLANNWMNGKPFFGIKNPASGEDPMAAAGIDSVLSVLRKTTPERVTDDLKSFTRIIYEFERASKLMKNTKELVFGGNEKPEEIVADVVSALTQMNPDNLTAEDREALNELAKAIGESELMKEAAAALVSDLSKTWLEGNVFAGLTVPPDVDETKLNDILTDMAKTTPESISDDLNALIGIFFEDQS